ncbi:hypothetical protein H109_02344 [Trichophyton interdigitale MR816]|uniref:Anaphase-promoting complex subunit 11 RING-H2 finger domain-containing protein n=1 Tax=Trichophyton interdigitale (strain MR816) TaxID=1215338 RepID=A0A059JDG6_TRIIM|nr:hypothetical protein H101_02069 [Trichophyton interdigitale H6]KDB25834.1 hypothetical protein H109_02344 [Trichophyton interdigitale MR816]
MSVAYVESSLMALVPHANILEMNARYHCLLTWIQQDSAKGLCPMCRQSGFYMNSDPRDTVTDKVVLEFEWKQNE